MAYRIEYKASVYNDLENIDKGEVHPIVDLIENEFTKDPIRGKPLKGEFKGLYKLRVGNYRVVFTKTGDSIIILRIGHRSKVYRKGFE